ncbi:MAG TPA: ABC transporter permease [Candidatus Sulfotelmatobacter sp.]|nr:ABC transporter permease [Candidatus Sulfotelmatobacter sp.]
MSRWKALYQRLRSLSRPDRLRDQIADEMDFHIEQRAADNVSKGMAPQHARQQAERRFGSATQLRDEGYEVRGLPMIETFWQDLKFGVRLLRRAPGFSLLALLCLTVGIGANAAVWSWVEGILLRPYPAVAHQERMMAIAGTVNGVPGAVGSTEPLSWPDFQDFAANCRLFDSFVVSRITGATIGVGERAEQVTGSIVSSNYFTALGVTPVLGRGFQPDEDQGRNAHPVAVISYELWRERYNGDPSIVGQTQLMNGEKLSIIGIAPAGFYGTFAGRTMNFWVPVSMQERFSASYSLEDRGARWIESYAIRKQRVTAEQAQQEISAVASRLETMYPATNRGHGVKLYPLWRTPFNQAGNLLSTLAIATAVVGFVLFIVCANVSNLLLVKGFARRREITVRLAVGAKRSRLLRQLLTEGFLLSVLAAGAGLIAANWARNLLVVLLPGGSQLNIPGAIDARVLSLSVAICLATAIVFGLVPALQMRDVDLAGTLNAEGASVVGTHRSAVVRSTLVVVQVALSFVLLVGAGLLIASLRQILATGSGFDDSHLLTAFVDFQSAGYKDATRTANTQDRIVERLEALPGVQSAAFARITPFSYSMYPSTPVAIDGSTLSPDKLSRISYNEVGPHYLATMGIDLVAGREFSGADNETSPLVAVVNQTMADQLWPGQAAVGLRIQVKGRWIQVVGVARTVKYRSITELPRPFFYTPLRQSRTGDYLEIRTSLPPDAVAKSLTDEARTVDASLPPASLDTMRAQIEWTTAPQQAALRVIAAFAGLALVLAVVGLYGVISYTVAQSSRELGLRMALGAGQSDLLRLVMWRGIKLTLAGVLIGVGISLACSRLLGYLLYHVSPRDPAVFVVASLLMFVSAVAASFVPAWRACRADPLSALRT